MSSSVDGQVFFTESFETTGDYTAGSAGDCSCVTADADAIDGQNDHFADVTDADITHNFVADYTGELDASGNVAEGTARYWASEDNDDPQVHTGAQACLTIPVNITGRTNLVFSGYFGAHNSSSPTPYEADNNLSVEYDIDGGGFIEILDFRENATETNMSLDTDNDNVGDNVIILGSVFQKVSAAIPTTGATLTLRICMNSNSSSEEFAVDYVQVEEFVAPFVCPTIGGATISESAVCTNEPFNVSATGLTDMGQSDNNEQDFGIEFVAFTSAPADPYSGGLSLGTVPFGDIAGGVANFNGATIGIAGTYTVYAILFPAPTEMTCRPFATTTSITVTASPTPTATSPGDFCSNDGVQMNLGDGLYCRRMC